MSIPADWNGKDVWFQLGTINDAYELFVNGKSVSIFGQANITVANRQTFTEVKQNIKYGESNQIAIRVNDWGSSDGLWRLVVILTIDKNESTSIFNPLSSTRHTPESLGYEIFWEDQFDGDKLDPDKWSPRGIGPLRGGYSSAEVIKVKDEFLELSVLLRGDSVLAGAFVGTEDIFMTKYTFFVDGYKYYEIKQAVSLIDEYIILSFEPAHTMEALKSATLPDVYIVDYVKVYKKK